MNGTNLTADELLALLHLVEDEIDNIIRMHEHTDHSWMYSEEEREENEKYFRGIDEKLLEMYRATLKETENRK